MSAHQRVCRRINISNKTWLGRYYNHSRIYCADGLKWRGNKTERTSDYPAREFLGGVYKVSNSDNIEIEE